MSQATFTLPTDAGQPLSVHGRSRTMIIPTVCAVIILLVGCSLPLVLLSGAHFQEGADTLLLMVSGGLVLVGLILLLLSFRMGPKTLITCYETGLAVENRKTHSGEFIPFAAISDVYQFRTGNYTGGLINAMAVRRNPQDTWVEILENRRDSMKLRASIIEGQLQYRTPNDLQKLANGESLTFAAIRTTDRLIKRAVGGMLKVKTYPVILSASQLTLDDRTLALSDIHDLQMSNAGTLSLLDARGDTLFTASPVTLFSYDLFVTLLSSQLQAGQPAYRELMAH